MDYVWIVMLIVGFIAGWFFNENFKIDFTKDPKVKAIVDAHNRNEELKQKSEEEKK